MCQSCNKPHLQENQSIEKPCSVMGVLVPLNQEKLIVGQKKISMLYIGALGDLQ